MGRLVLSDGDVDTLQKNITGARSKAVRVETDETKLGRCGDLI